MTDNAMPAAPAPAEEDDEISLLDLLIVLAKHLKTILATTFGAAVLAAGFSLTMANIYTATSKILPPQQGQSSAAAMLGQLGALAGMAGGAVGIKNPNELYVSMLKSRTVADAMIARLQLQTYYKQEKLTDTRSALQGATVISSGKDGIITIEVSDKDPKQAALLTNAYVEELYKLTQTLAVTEASQRRLFIEKQLKIARDGLTAAEQALRVTQETSGLIKLDDQGKAMIETVARLRAMIAAKEVELGAMRVFATERNPRLLPVQQELAALREQLAKSEKNGSVDSAGNLFIPTGKLPEIGLEYIRKYREMKYYEAIFEMLARQYEMAKIDEAKDASLIQVLDAAIEPERKSKPKRSLIVMLTALATLFVTILWVFIKEASEKARQNPAQAERLQVLRGYLPGFKAK